MSTAANHRKRSHRSYQKTRSALGNMAKRTYYREASRGSGASSAPLIYRLRSFSRKILGAKNKQETVEGE